jgi:DNA replication ATP-dependent helicase Dna2
LRSIIIDLQPPRFHTSPHPKGNPDSESTSGLNLNQISALNKVLSSKDYCLILGRPGTGKTTTISKLVQTMVGRGASVLVTSYTHSAVDNILLKLKEAGVDFLRLGSKHAVQPSLHQFLPSNTMCTSVSELEALYNSKSVVATTCLGVNHAIFSRRTFDYCIVDEASQLTLPVSLGPLRCAAVFVLVGDHYQLPPLVRDSEAR